MFIETSVSRTSVVLIIDSLTLASTCAFFLGGGGGNVIWQDIEERPFLVGAKGILSSCREIRIQIPVGFRKDSRN